MVGSPRRRFGNIQGPKWRYGYTERPDSMAYAISGLGIQTEVDTSTTPTARAWPRCLPNSGFWRNDSVLIFTSMTPKHINGHYVQFSPEKPVQFVDRVRLGRRVTIRGPKCNDSFTTSSLEVRKWKWLRDHIQWLTQ